MKGEPPEQEGETWGLWSYGIPGQVEPGWHVGFMEDEPKSYPTEAEARADIGKGYICKIVPVMIRACPRKFAELKAELSRIQKHIQGIRKGINA